MSAKKGMTYRDSGVDIDAGSEAVKRLLPFAKATHGTEVIGGIGGFGAAFRPNLKGFESPVLVSGADGVGSKLKIAFEMHKHDTIGIDCVAMNCDDVVCSGARPLFFLDYLAMPKVIPSVVADIVKGLSEGCRQAGCALIGGETAELPDFYAEGEYDLAGFCVGMVDEMHIIDGSRVKPGDVLIGLASSGLHSNGFSLVRKALLPNYSLDSYIAEFGRTLGEELLEPTRVYAGVLSELFSLVDVKAVTHITGGGFYDNIPRALPKTVRARVSAAGWPIPPVFDLLQRSGRIETAEMYRVFNMGIGMTLIVREPDADRTLAWLKERGFLAWAIGDIVSGEHGVDILGKSAR